MPVVKSYQVSKSNVFIELSEQIINSLHETLFLSIKQYDQMMCGFDVRYK